MNSSKANKGTAVVTGASSGIGAVYADRLAKRGYDVLLVARNKKRLEALSSKLSASTKVKVEVLVADLTLRADLRGVEDRLRKDSDVTLLVNNAGSAWNVPLAESDLDRLESMIQLNVIALTRLSGAVLPAFIKRGTGIIINIASVVALAPKLNAGATYNGTKAFILNFTQSMQNELSGKGIQVHAVLPGAIDTEIWELAGTPISTLPTEMVMSAEDMVDAALAGLDQSELVTIPSLPDIKDWEAFLAARDALLPNLSRSKPAARYSHKLSTSSK
jgi:short-subunit dehydrogenase